MIESGDDPSALLFTTTNDWRPRAAASMHAFAMARREANPLGKWVRGNTKQSLLHLSFVALIAFGLALLYVVTRLRADRIVTMPRRGA